MRKLSIVLVVAMLLVSVLPALAQSSADIVDIAVTDGRFTTLVAAVQAAGLVDTLKSDGPFTVFAPTDEAFAAALSALNIDPAALLADTDLLSSILLYHVVAGEALAADVVGLDAVTTVEGSDIAIKVEDGNVYLNDSIQVIITDIEASNGVLHVIDGVLLPPAENAVTAETPGTIVDIAVADGRFSTLVSAVQAAGLVETLSSDGPFTVFAPTDDAFAALPAGTVDALLGNIPALTDILLYHVVPGEVYAADVVNLESATTALGLDVAIRVEDGHVYINDSQVILTDIQASNGVIHVIDSVILPPAYVRNNGTNNLNFRSGPGLDQSILGLFPADAIAEALGRDSAGEWLQIAYEGTTGWVFAGLSSLSVDIDSLPVTGQTIVDLAVANSDFSTLVAAVQAAGLVDALNGPGPFTIFAPTNDAFAAALSSLEISAADLLADTEMLTSILLYHVVEGEVLAADVVGLESANTLQGAPVGISVRDGNVFLNDGVQVVATDIAASNGVIHVIDGVLLPPQ
jgi:transforming growth factor-beta-induced protein